MGVIKINKGSQRNIPETLEIAGGLEVVWCSEHHD